MGVLFKTALVGGFQKEEVIEYIEKLKNDWAEEERRLQEELRQTREEEKRAWQQQEEKKEENRRLEEELSQAREQIRTLDKRRLRERMGRVDGAVMERVDDAIAVSFGLPRSRLV